MERHSREGSAEYHHEYRILTPSGEVRWVEDHTTICRDEQGQVRCYEGVLTDITERKQAETALQESEQRFRLAIEEAPIPIIMHAEDGTVLALSRAWCELTGYSPAEIPSMEAWTSLAYGPHKAMVEAKINKMFRQPGYQLHGEIPVYCKDGSYREWEFKAVVLGRLNDGLV